LFKELEDILRDPHLITFIVPDPETIKRNLDNLEYERRRNRIKKAEELVNQLRRILVEIDDPELRKEYIKKLEEDH